MSVSIGGRSCLLLRRMVAGRSLGRSSVSSKTGSYRRPLGDRSGLSSSDRPSLCLSASELSSLGLDCDCSAAPGTNTKRRSGLCSWTSIIRGNWSGSPRDWTSSSAGTPSTLNSLYSLASASTSSSTVGGGGRYWEQWGPGVSRSRQSASTSSASSSTVGGGGRKWGRRDSGVFRCR